MPPPEWDRNEESESSDDSSDDSDDSDDSSDVSSTGSSDLSTDSSDNVPAASAQPGAKPGAAGSIMNRPHDEEFNVNDQHQATPRDVAASGAPQATGSGQVVSNNPHDEEVEVTGEAHTATPREAGKPTHAAPANPAAGTGAKSGLLQNMPDDEFEDVEDDLGEDDVPTPNKSGPAAGSPPRQLNAEGLVRNEHHDEEISAGDASPTTTTQGGSTQASPQRGPMSMGGMRPDGDEDDTSSSDDSDDSERLDHGGQGHTQQQQQQQQQQATGKSGPEYDAADYAYLNNKVSAEVRDVFTYISAYEPAVVECPAKLRPYVPDFIPSVGDIDTFCKVPRPDNRPDNLGLVLVDEPSSNQSNPAVELIALRNQNLVAPTGYRPIDSVENAANRPEVINRWINDLKDLQYKKPLTTVSYSKPMPDIEQLMQAWPQEFEEILASDLPLPPSNIDLTIQQYVKLLCALLDIPSHSNLVEPLHVMFMLYLEFRENQHFKNA